MNAFNQAKYYHSVIVLLSEKNNEMLIPVWRALAEQDYLILNLDILQTDFSLLADYPASIVIFDDYNALCNIAQSAYMHKLIFCADNEQALRDLDAFTQEREMLIDDVIVSSSRVMQKLLAQKIQHYAQQLKGNEQIAKRIESAQETEEYSFAPIETLEVEEQRYNDKIGLDDIESIKYSSSHILEFDDELFEHTHTPVYPSMSFTAHHISAIQLTYQQIYDKQEQYLIFNLCIQSGLAYESLAQVSIDEALIGDYYQHIVQLILQEVAQFRQTDSRLIHFVLNGELLLLLPTETRQQLLTQIQQQCKQANIAIVWLFRQQQFKDRRYLIGLQELNVRVALVLSTNDEQQIIESLALDIQMLVLDEQIMNNLQQNMLSVQQYINQLKQQFNTDLLLTQVMTMQDFAQCWQVDVRYILGDFYQTEKKQLQHIIHQKVEL